MPGPIMVGPPHQPQLDEAKQKIVEERATKVLKALEGLPIADVPLVFNKAHEMVMKRTKV